MSVLDGPRELRGDHMTYEISHLRALESEAIHVIREVAAELERGVLLFSGGKDSAVLLHLARKAFHPAGLPFPVMHVDTGHNFPEVLVYRDRMVEDLGARLIVASVQEWIDFGQWDPKAQRPELWNIYNGFVKPGEHVRVFPLSNWTELDVWQYIREEKIVLPGIYFAHKRDVFRRDGMLYAVSDFVELLPGE